MAFARFARDTGYDRSFYRSIILAIDRVKKRSGKRVKNRSGKWVKIDRALEFLASRVNAIDPYVPSIVRLSFARQTIDRID